MGLVIESGSLQICGGKVQRKCNCPSGCCLCTNACFNNASTADFSYDLLTVASSNSNTSLPFYDPGWDTSFENKSTTDATVKNIGPGTLIWDKGNSQYDPAKYPNFQLLRYKSFSGALAWIIQLPDPNPSTPGGSNQPQVAFIFFPPQEWQFGVSTAPGSYVATMTDNGSLLSQSLTVSSSGSTSDAAAAIVAGINGSSLSLFQRVTAGGNYNTATSTYEPSFTVNSKVAGTAAMTLTVTNCTASTMPAYLSGGNVEPGDEYAFALQSGQVCPAVDDAGLITQTLTVTSTSSTIDDLLNQIVTAWNASSLSMFQRTTLSKFAAGYTPPYSATGTLTPFPTYLGPGLQILANDVLRPFVGYTVTSSANAHEETLSATTITPNQTALAQIRQILCTGSVRVGEVGLVTFSSSALTTSLAITSSSTGLSTFRNQIISAINASTISSQAIASAVGTTTTYLTANTTNAPFSLSVYSTESDGSPSTGVALFQGVIQASRPAIAEQINLLLGGSIEIGDTAVAELTDGTTTQTVSASAATTSLADLALGLASSWNASTQSFVTPDTATAVTVSPGIGVELLADVAGVPLKSLKVYTIDSDGSRSTGNDGLQPTLSHQTAYDFGGAIYHTDAPTDDSYDMGATAAGTYDGTSLGYTLTPADMRCGGTFPAGIFINHSHPPVTVGSSPHTTVYSSSGKVGYGTMTVAVKNNTCCMPYPPNQICVKLASNAVCTAGGNCDVKCTSCSSTYILVLADGSLAGTYDLVKTNSPIPVDGQSTGCYWKVVSGIVTLIITGSIITITNTARQHKVAVTPAGTVEVGDKFQVQIVYITTTYTANFTATAATIANVLGGLTSAVNATSGAGAGFFSATNNGTSVVIAGVLSGVAPNLLVSASTTESDGSAADGQSIATTVTQTGLAAGGVTIAMSSATLWDGCPPEDGWAISSDSTGLTSFTVTKG